jgi:hypothetical protein
MIDQVESFPEVENNHSDCRASSIFILASCIHHADQSLGVVDGFGI